MIWQMKKNYSSLPEGIVPELTKYGSDKLLRIIQHIFQRTINGKKLPKEWTQGYYITSVQQFIEKSYLKIDQLT